MCAFKIFIIHSEVHEALTEIDKIALDIIYFYFYSFTIASTEMITTPIYVVKRFHNY